MYFLALAADYDGTLAEHGAVMADTLAALRRLKEGGRRLFLVTGRELADLRHAFAELDLFDRVVVENGAVVYDPATGRERPIAPPPSPALVERLMRRGVEPISVGHSILATWEPHEKTVLEAIHELGLELQITFNKGAVMVLPPGVNKASGLKAALAELDISRHNTVAVGDAQNDHAFLSACGCAAAVANALPALKEEADLVLSGDHGRGVAELIEELMAKDIAMVPTARHGLLVGTGEDGEEIFLPPQSCTLLAGASGAGKSQFATLLTERMAERDFEFCVFDPEGDYEGLQNAVGVGERNTPPAAAEAAKLLRETGVNVVVNALALPREERQALFAELLPPVAELKARSGRPQWILLDEAHHVLPSTAGDMHEALEGLPATIFVTVSPDLLAASALRRVDIALAFGGKADETLKRLAEVLGLPAPLPKGTRRENEILFWDLRSGKEPRRVRVASPRQRHHRHRGKYAAGDVGAWHSFYFRGPQRRLNLPARNLGQFLKLAEGVDDATWEHHLRAGDYSAWFRHVIRDEALAHETQAIEADTGIDARESRRRIRSAVTRRYVEAEGSGG
ncbi:HAD family hydrolase [Afifella pfennigii]|uniref:HAD-IIB family hydrolase n=1 Tax=Afifella pfennigii TaxID=209897 RepID=UPI00047E8B81|nr:HAD-IIB family hydrolase [Afifella pfennigii]